MRRALRITEAGLKRAMEVLKASKPGSGKRLRWNGKTLTSEILRAEIDSADFARRRRSGRTRSSPEAIRRAIRTSAATARSTRIR